MEVQIKDFETRNRTLITDHCSLIADSFFQH